MSDTVTVTPTGLLTQIADDIWIVDAKPIRANGLLLPVRMGIVRLRNGDLLLHSPTRFSPKLQASVEQLGPIRHLVAPNVAHWMFLRAWQLACPGAKTWAAPGLGARRQVRKAGVRVDAELGDTAPDAWREDIEQVLFRGPGFSEVDFFHRPSRTLFMTDLAINVSTRRLPPISRFVIEKLNIAAPHGGTPIYLRALLEMNRQRTRRAAARLIAFEPARVILAHGNSFERHASARLRDVLAWASAPHPRLQGKTVVITGATSGIGRAAALAFAERGARVSLAARREDVLEDVARECADLGGQALVVPTDVTDPAAVAHLADRTLARFGSIDVWINNAGTGVFGPFQDADVALHRQTIAVNLGGAINGAAAVLPIFILQKRGTLINNVSLGGWSPTPFAAAYTASKFGLRGFNASLRQELTRYTRIHVCGVFPSIVDTPGFEHGANVSGRNLDPGPFQYRPEDVAETFVRLALRPRDEVAVGWPARAAQVAYALAPKLTENATGAVFRALLLRARPAPHSEGALLKPIAAGAQVSGGWLDRKGLPSAKFVSAGLVTVGAFGLVATALYADRVRRRRG